MPRGPLRHGPELRDAGSISAVMDSSREGPEEEREDAAGSGGAVRDAAALYRQIWGIDPEPSPPGRTRTGTLRPTAPAEPTGQDAGSDGPAARDLSPRLVALERRVLELSRRLEAEELEVARDHGRAIASLERRLAEVERELREFTHSFDGRMERFERTLHRFIDVLRKIATPHPPSQDQREGFEH
jgi:hypothetical protein